MKKNRFLKRTAQCFRRPCVFLIIVFILHFSFSSFARINLPQILKSLQIAREDQDRLINYFKGFENNSNVTIDKDIEKILLNNLGSIYDSACSEMISYWGKVAEGTASLMLSIIFIANDKQSSKKYVLLGIKCYSNYEEYREKYCDERLAVLLIDSQNASINLLPHAKDCTNCSELSKIKYEQIVQKRNPLIISLSIITANDNPCCGGAYQYSEEKINYYAFVESGVKQVASIIRYQTEYLHDDIDGDYIKVYKSNIKNELDQKEKYTQIVSEYIITKNEVEEENGTKFYIWNPEKEQFELIN